MLLFDDLSSCLNNEFLSSSFTDSLCDTNLFCFLNFEVIDILGWNEACLAKRSSSSSSYLTISSTSSKRAWEIFFLNDGEKEAELGEFEAFCFGVFLLFTYKRFSLFFSSSMIYIEILGAYSLFSPNDFLSGLVLNVLPIISISLFTRGISVSYLDCT